MGLERERDVSTGNKTGYLWLSSVDETKILNQHDNQQEKKSSISTVEQTECVKDKRWESIKDGWFQTSN